MRLQDISNVSPWSQITAQFNLFNSGSDSSPSASTAGRRLLQANSSFADFAPQDTTTSDLTKEGTASRHLLCKLKVDCYGFTGIVQCAHNMLTNQGVKPSCHNTAQDIIGQKSRSVA